MKIKIDFQTFWNAYGLKRDRIAAERAFLSLSATDRNAAFRGIQSYREDCQRRGIAMMYAQGYLRHRRWEDDFDAPEAPPSPPPPQTPTTPTSPEPDDMELW